ncbi:MAG TPA: hypothetical protein VHX88_02670 [Solirubrobacteraceae bacterium]|nr:hypothetical protein [Solirubrobacteraceae bacterium]
MAGPGTSIEDLHGRLAELCEDASGLPGETLDPRAPSTIHRAALPSSCTRRCSAHAHCSPPA